MLIVLKSLHLLCLLGGGAAVIGNMVLIGRVRKSGEPPQPAVRATLNALRKLGLWAISLLWATGVFMWALGPGNVPLQGAFAGKLAAAALVLAIALWLARGAARAAAGGPAPDPGLVRQILHVSAAATMLAIILAVVTFN